MEEMKSNDLYLDSDGTLGISADVDISKVRRILLTQEGTHYGSMYYLDDSDHIAEVSKKVDSDLISRQAAIDAVYKCADIFVGDMPVMVVKADAYEALAQLPSAQPEQRWIPCSERMPDQYGNYLISIEGDEPDIGTINPNDPRGWSLCDATGFYWASDKALNITAWMPLPGPYKEESNG